MPIESCVSFASRLRCPSASRFICSFICEYFLNTWAYLAVRMNMLKDRSIGKPTDSQRRIPSRRAQYDLFVNSSNDGAPGTAGVTRERGREILGLSLSLLFQYQELLAGNGTKAVLEREPSLQPARRPSRAFSR